MTCRHVLVVLALIVAGSQLQSRVIGEELFRYSKEADRLFEQGLALVKEERFLASLETFEKILRIAPFHQRVTAAYVMKAKVLLALEENAEAVRVLKEFLSEYNWSTYVPDAQYALGLTYFRVGRYEEAVYALLAGWERLDYSTTSPLAKKIESTLVPLIQKHISFGTIRGRLSGSGHNKEREFLWLMIAEKELARGNVTGAKAAADSLQRFFPDGRYAGRIDIIQSGIVSGSAIRLGALLPLMRQSPPSAAKQVGNEVYEGVVAAVDEHNSDPATVISVTLETRDTERDAIVALKGARDLVAMDDLVAIVGPVFTHTTTAVIGIANMQGVPLITPTANGNGIAASGEWVFQANPDFENRGRAMARYAVEVLGVKLLGVLAPSDAHGKFMADAFIGEVQRLGARIVAAEWYTKGTSDFSQQLGNLRRASMRVAADPIISFSGKLRQRDLVHLVSAGVSKKRLDSLMERGASVPASVLLGQNARTLLDSLQIPNTADEARYDSLEYPATGIEGIYLPITGPDEIGVVSSQIVYFNFRTQMLGSGEWNDLAELDASKRYTRGVIFDSDNFTDVRDPDYGRFVSRFHASYGKKPSRNTLYGYDTARLLLTHIAAGGTSRQRLRTMLSETQGVRGLHSYIGLFPRRVNSWLSILKYEGDAIRKLQDLNVDDPDVAGRR